MQPDIALLRQQIGVCKQIITDCRAAGGAERLDNVEPVPADRWLDSAAPALTLACTTRPAGRRRLKRHATAAGTRPSTTHVSNRPFNLLNNAAS